VKVERITRLALFYNDQLKKLGYQPNEMHGIGRHNTVARYEHARWLCQQIVPMAASGDVVGAALQLGMVQGILLSLGMYDQADLSTHVWLESTESA